MAVFRFASSALGAHIVDDSVVSADRVAVYGVVSRAVADTGIMHSSDD